MKIIGRLRWEPDDEGGGVWCISVESGDAFPAGTQAPCENMWAAFNDGDRVEIEARKLE
jgi:hypothetical protein